MKALAPVHSLPANSTTVSLDLSKESCPELFKSHTMKITIVGKGHPNLRGHIIRQLISDKPTLLLNYGRGDTWYFRSDANDVTKFHNTIKTHGPYTLQFTSYDQTRIDGTLRWVTSILSNECLIHNVQPKRSSHHQHPSHPQPK